MKTVILGPSLDDVVVSGGTISASMDGMVLTYRLPQGMEFDDADLNNIRQAFWQACILGSKRWHIEDMLNNVFGVAGVFMITRKPVLGKEEVELR